MQNFVNSHIGSSAWILGAGYTLNDVWDWQVPPNTYIIALNSASFWSWGHWQDGIPLSVPKRDMAQLADYRRPLDYWFAIDNIIFQHTYEPEWTYCNIAMRHPTCKKIIRDSLSIQALTGSGCNKSLIHPTQMNFGFLRDADLDSRKNGDGLMIGCTVLIPALHFCWKAGFKNIFLSGIDFCRMIDKDDKLVDVGEVDEKGQPIMEAKAVPNGMTMRRFWSKQDISRTAIAKKHDADIHLSIEQARHLTVAPDGEYVYQDTMMVNHMNRAMPFIRGLQMRGVNVIKTGSRGMAAIPWIRGEEDMRKIAGGKEFKVRYS